jgi:hypothetical protein
MSLILPELDLLIGNVDRRPAQAFHQEAVLDLAIENELAQPTIA